MEIRASRNKRQSENLSLLLGGIGGGCVDSSDSGGSGGRCGDGEGGCGKCGGSGGGGDGGCDVGGGNLPSV